MLESLRRRSSGQSGSPSRSPLEEIRRHYRIDRRQIAFFRFLLEACGGLAVARTVDPVKGLVVLYLSESREPELEKFIEGAAAELQIEPVEPNTADTARNRRYTPDAC